MVGATLLPNDTCQVFVTTTSIRYLNLTNFIPAGVITSAQGFTNALGTQASLSTLQGLGLTKGFAPAYIPPGATARLILQLISTFDPNAVSPVTITGMSFTDPLPAGLVFAPVPECVHHLPRGDPHGEYWHPGADDLRRLTAARDAVSDRGGRHRPGGRGLREPDRGGGASSR